MILKDMNVTGVNFKGLSQRLMVSDVRQGR
jgi:hypothetical protein